MPKTPPLEKSACQVCTAGVTFIVQRQTNALHKKALVFQPFIRFIFVQIHFTLIVFTLTSLAETLGHGMKSVDNQITTLVLAVQHV